MIKGGISYDSCGAVDTAYRHLSEQKAKQKLKKINGERNKPFPVDF